MIIAHELVLQILGHILESVERAVERYRCARRTARQELEVGPVRAYLDGVPVPVVLVRQPPVGRDTLNDVGGGAIQGPGGARQLVRGALLRRSIAAELGVQRLIPHRVRGQARYVLTESAVDL